MAGTEQTSHGEEGAAHGFRKGDLVVYPGHGAGCVDGIEERTILGEERKYYVVQIPDGELTLSIPAGGDSTLRPCCSEDEVEAAFDVLRGEATDMPGNWNHRFKHNQGKIRNGEILEVAEVVRNLSTYGAEHSLSTGERNMLLKARRILASEMALVKGMEIDETETLINDALRQSVK